jgi:surface protein
VTRSGAATPLGATPVVTTHLGAVSTVIPASASLGGGGGMITFKVHTCGEDTAGSIWDHHVPWSVCRVKLVGCPGGGGGCAHWRYSDGIEMVPTNNMSNAFTVTTDKYKVGDNFGFAIVQQGCMPEQEEACEKATDPNMCKIQNSCDHRYDSGQKETDKNGISTNTTCWSGGNKCWSQSPFAKPEADLKCLAGAGKGPWYNRIVPADNAGAVEAVWGSCAKTPAEAGVKCSVEANLQCMMDKDPNFISPWIHDGNFKALLSACLSSRRNAGGDPVNGNCPDGQFGPIKTWDVHRVTKFAGAFMNLGTFNGDLSKWNVSNAEDMSSMFSGAIAFNGDISNWETGKVQTMQQMFEGATAFNKELNTDGPKWDTSSVINMDSMFVRANVFNKPIGGWNTAKVTTMANMFNLAQDFDQDISGWTTSAVTSMEGMFEWAWSYNKPLTNWDVSKVISMKTMFKKAEYFNQDLTKWNVSSVLYMDEMFNDAFVFLSDIRGWKINAAQNVTDQNNQNGNGVTNVLDSINMFLGAEAWEGKEVNGKYVGGMYINKNSGYSDTFGKDIDVHTGPPSDWVLKAPIK